MSIAPRVMETEAYPHNDQGASSPESEWGAKSFRCAPSDISEQLFHTFFYTGSVKRRVDINQKAVVEFLDASMVEINTNPRYVELSMGESEIVCCLILRVQDEFGVGFADAFFAVIEWDHDRYGMITDE